MILALVNAALPLLLAATAEAAPALPAVHLDADTVRADDKGTWVVPLTLHNPGAMGLYGDSMYVDITDLDPGVSRAPRRSTVSMAFWVQRGGAVGGGEDKTLMLSLQATCERARIALRMYEHDGAHASYVFRESLLAEPGAQSAALPSTFLALKAGRIEIVTAGSTTAGPAPGVLLVPSETAHARKLARTASQLAARGMNVVAVSPPGYGLSDGPADMAGPATLAALEAALAKLAALPGTDRKRLAVWGAGRGATAALLLAARHPEITRVVAHDAGYDLRASWRAADAATAANIVAEAGGDSAGWKARSPLLVAGKLAAAVLVIQGGDPAVPAGPARAFVAARLAAHAPVDTIWAAPGAPRPRKDPLRAGIEFLAAPAGH
jgi:pimeloyl-ACP methyl ester carboxylesterase